MNEQVVAAIVKLLAMSARLDGVQAVEIALVRRFFNELLPANAVERFMVLFDKTASSADVSEEGIERYCRQLNQDLTYEQKVIAIVRLLEIGLADHHLSEREQWFIRLVAEKLKLDESVLELLFTFTTTEDSTSLSSCSCSDSLLCLSAGAEKPEDRIYHHHGLPGVLLFAHVDKTELYFARAIRLDREADMTMQGQRFEMGHVYALAPGSTIRSSDAAPIFHSDIVSRFRPIDIESQTQLAVDHVWYKFKSKNWGLRDISFEAYSGDLVAIMGASGSGKSTLLNVLNGSVGPTKGSVRLNGQYDMFVHHKQVMSMVGYVPQDDLLIDELTVWENLRLAASISIKGQTDDELDELVRQTLTRLGLWETRNLKVGSPLEKTISGGQRKRVNIGLELLRKPQILFVDEPTSGLSSHDSENIIELLRELALGGNLVFVVIHQPSSTIFKMFNKLLVLDTGGYQLYYGNPLDAVVYFRTHEDLLNKVDAECPSCGNVNSEEIFQIIERRMLDEYGWESTDRRRSPDQWAALWAQHRREVSQPVAEVQKNNISENRKTGRFKQFWVHLQRNVLSKVRNRQYLLLNALQAPLLALLLGGILRFDRINDLTQSEDYIFRENMNLPVFIFVSVIVALFMGLLVSAEEIIKDRKIRQREAFLDLSWSSYLWAKILLLFTLSAIQTGVFVLIANHLMGIEGLNFYYWMALFSVSCFANLLGLNISDSFNSAVTIYIMVPLVLIPQLVLGGVVVRFDNMNPHVSDFRRVPILGELMASRWAFEALTVKQYTENEYQKVFFNLEKQARTAHFKASVEIEKTLISKLEDCKSGLEYAGSIPEAELESDIAIIKSFAQQERLISQQDGAFIRDSLSVKHLSFRRLDRAIEILKSCRDEYIRKSNALLQERNALTMKRFKTGAEKAALVDRYTNDRLKDFVLDIGNPDAIVQVGGALIRKFEPIHYDPDYFRHPLDFRAHFLAPRKYLLDRYFPTPVFNLGVIWAMTALLYLTILFRLGRGFGRIRLRARNIGRMLTKS